MVRYWKLPCITAAMHTDWCCSSNGRSRGPDEHTICGRPTRPGPQRFNLHRHPPRIATFPKSPPRGRPIHPPRTATNGGFPTWASFKLCAAPAPAEASENVAVWLADRRLDHGRHHAATTDGAPGRQGTIHFGWVLEGRAIQDVWILPGFFHGTTLRIYDPNLDAWHILWSDPLRQYFTRQIGRARGNDIVQEGRNDAGEPTRWRFTDITPNSFRWIGERSLDDGATLAPAGRFSTLAGRSCRR